MNARLKVLVAGISYAPNQFTRALEKYDCESIHIDGGAEGKSKISGAPRFADAAIVVSSYTSHHRYYDVKEVYKSRNKPVFLVGHSFSEMKDRFENWLLKTRGYILPAPKVTVGELQVPEAWVKESSPKQEIKPEPQTQTKEPQVQGLSRAERTEKVEAVISRMRAKGATAHVIVDELNKSGIVKNGGAAWTIADVYAYASRMGKQQRHQPKAQAQAQARAQAQAPAPRAFDPVLLIQQITAAPLEAMEKVQLIAKVTVGEIKQVEFTDKAVIDDRLYIERVSILRKKEQNPNLTLTRDQANLILDNLAALNEFVNTEIK